jgi:hypothetical protein
MEHVVERVEEKIVEGVMKVADKVGAVPHDEPKPTNEKSARYIASSPLETGTEETTPPPEHHAHAPSLQRYDEMLADELQYQEQLYPTMEDVPGCMTLL